VKIRYNSKATEATVYPQGENVTVEFDEPVSAITPGQLAAFYVEDDLGNKVVGGGWIDHIGN
jgi:tRNA-specific 2-thiouridylase